MVGGNASEAFFIKVQRFDIDADRDCDVFFARLQDHAARAQPSAEQPVDRGHECTQTLGLMIMILSSSRTEMEKEYLFDMLAELAILAHSCNERRIGLILQAIIADDEVHDKWTIGPSRKTRPSEFMPIGRP